MNTNPYPARHMPPLSVSYSEIANLGHELATAEYCEQCDPLLTRTATAIAHLTTQVYELRAALAAERLRSANLEAAIRAALGAHHDGEADPFGYLRDELPDMAGGDAYGA
jgi:hypothetical protein